MPSEPRLTVAQEARFRVLDRMRHDRWCSWKEERDCKCKAGRLMLELIEAEVGELWRHVEDEGEIDEERA